jgi:hypothetical protein
MDISSPFPAPRIAEIADEVIARLREAEAPDFRECCWDTFTALGIHDLETRGRLVRLVALELSSRRTSLRHSKGATRTGQTKKPRKPSRDEIIKDLAQLLQEDRLAEDYACGPLAANEHIVPID